jgi:hypothetical protein
MQLYNRYVVTIFGIIGNVSLVVSIFGIMSLIVTAAVGTAGRTSAADEATVIPLTQIGCQRLSGNNAWQNNIFVR